MLKQKHNQVTRHIAFPQSMWDWLKDQAQESGNSPSAIIRQAVSRKIDNDNDKK